MMSKRLWYVALGNLGKPFIAATIHCREDVRGLRRCGWDATLYSQADQPISTPEGVKESVVCKNRPLIYRLIFELAMCLKLLSRAKPDFVMMRGTRLVLFTLALRLTGVPYGLELCGPPQCFLGKGGFLGNWGDRYLIRHAAVFICLTRELEELVLPLKRPDAAVAVTGVGVNSETYQVARSQTPNTFEGPVLGFLGTLYADRGLGCLIDGVAELDRLGVKAKLLVVGDGPYRAQAEQKAKDMNLGDRIVFKGWVCPDKVADALAECDLTVALYEREIALTVGGINPMKVWTSLAVGKPILLYNPGKFDAYASVPGIFVCPQARPAEVAELVAQTWSRLGRKGLAQAGIAGRKYVEQNVTWLSHAQVIDRTIRQAIHTECRRNSE